MLINHYSLWKYIMLIVIMIIGLLYALPNLYGEDPAIQVTGIHGIVVDNKTLIQVQKTLKKGEITVKSLILKKGTVTARLTSVEDQFHASETLSQILGDKYVVKIKLISAAPNWLTALKAEPIKLGLDLRGGIHFLMEVDMNTVMQKLQEESITNLRRDLQEKNIHYTLLHKKDNCTASITFHDSISRDKAFDYLFNRYHDLVIVTHGKDQILAIISNSRLKKAREYAIQQNINILRNRVNQLGIFEPIVQRQGDNNIVIELPGIQDIAYAKEILNATATLEFRLVNTDVNQDDVISGRIPDNSELKQTSEGHLIVLYKHTILTGDHIIDSTCNQDEYNQQQVNISLDRVGSSIISNFSRKNIGKLMAILFTEYKDSGKKDINGHIVFIKEEKIINLANIQSQLDNRFRITGIVNKNEACQLSLLLRAGTLIAPIQIIEERTIGPALGAKNIKQGLRACLASLVISIIFMIFFYKKFGLIATIALFANLILITSIMSLLPGVTLTMPGIAGIILTLAVAIDANVLINERIKEELNNGRSIQQAINEGYKGAFRSIIDANITTLIKTIILYTVGTGAIKGFAIITSIGISTSMFTAIIGTRAMVNFLYGGRRIKRLSI